MLARVARALRTFHDGPPIPGSFDSFRVVEDYRETALARGGAIPPDYDWAHELARGSRRAAAAPHLVPCHNDLLNANFLDDGERLRIVDWEYAGMGDPFFDLANFSINHELDERAPRAARGLLGDVEPRTRARARAHALHVRLPRGDVGRRPDGGLGARLRLRRLRGRALRAAASGRPPSPRSAPRSRPERREGARRRPSLDDRESRASRRPRSEARTARAAPPPAARAPPPCPSAPAPRTTCGPRGATSLRRRARCRRTRGSCSS